MGEIMSFTLELGSKPKDFNLLGTDGKQHSLKEFTKGKALVVFFTCNHCPFVIGSDEVTRATANKFIPQGVNFVAINSNSVHVHAEDSYDHMIKRMKKEKFPWTYLRDEDQQTALAYGALRTPHFYLFDEKMSLVYTGRGIDNPRESSKMTVNDLDNALTQLMAEEKISVPHTNPIGCNVKWKDHDEHWMPAEACDLVL
jgi:peroxiredoxin